jgi:adenosylmethionine-8-amino-7-oxononanoate aminotransferase
MRSFRKQYPRAVRGDKAWIFDEQGRGYLDLAGSAAVSFIGHGDPEIAHAIAGQLARLEFAHTTQFATEVAEDFARELLEFAGPAFSGGAVYFTSGGSEAVETALKLARAYQVESGHDERYEIISRHQSYHGATLGAMAVSGNPRRRKQYLPMMREFRHINTPYCYRCIYQCEDARGSETRARPARARVEGHTCAAEYALELERAIAESEGKSAAFICEPVSGATLGAALPPDGYMQHVRRICNAHGLLWIADEVMTGCGRTGRNFAWEHWQSAPDIIVAGKGLSSGYAPLGAVITSRKVVEAIASGSGAFIHGFTYNAHPVSTAAGRAVLARVRELRLVQAADNNLEGSAATEFAAALATLRDCASVGDVRGIGLLWGVEFVADKASKRAFAPELNFAGRVGLAAAKRGLMLYPMQGCVDGLSGDHLLIAPPAMITAEQITWALEQLSAAIEEAAG